jgi:hypothetical protein
MARTTGPSRRGESKVGNEYVVKAHSVSLGVAANWY